MNNLIYKVQLINQGMELTEWLSLASFVISVISVLFVIWDRYKRATLEKKKLIVSIKRKYANWKEGAFFLYVIFTNESSTPLSLLDMNLSANKGQIPSGYNQNPGGSVIFHPIKVIETNTDNKLFTLHNPEIIDHQVMTEKVPITVAPFESFGGFIAFSAGLTSAQTLLFQNFTLNITTSKGPLTYDLLMLDSSFHRFSYDGENVYGMQTTEPLNRWQSIKRKTQKLLKK